MVRIVARLILKPGMEDLFWAEAKDLVKASKAENGNVDYSLNVSRENPRLYVFMEVWRDQGAVASHSASPHFTRIFPKLIDMSEGEPTIELFNEISF